MSEVEKHCRSIGFTSEGKCVIHEGIAQSAPVRRICDDVLARVSRAQKIDATDSVVALDEVC